MLPCIEGGDTRSISNLLEQIAFRSALFRLLDALQYCGVAAHEIANHRQQQIVVRRNPRPAACAIGWQFRR